MVLKLFSFQVVARQIGDPGLLNTFSKFCSKAIHSVLLFIYPSEYKLSVGNK